MDSIKVILNTLTEEEKNSFKLFINRDKSIDNRKDLQLFNLLDKTVDPKPAVVLSSIYPDRNKSAYSALRRRLFDHLMDFISLNNNQYELEDDKHLDRLKELAKHLFHQKDYSACWKYLNKAVDIAEKSSNYVYLNDLYQMQIEWSHTISKFDIGKCVQKFKANSALVEDLEKAKIAEAMVRSKVKGFKGEGDQSYLEKIIDMLLFTYQLKDKIDHRPELSYRIAKATRESIDYKKDFLSFESFIQTKFEALEKNKAFGPQNHYYKIKMMQLILDALYRNKKFTLVTEIAEDFKKVIYEYDQSFHYAFYPKYLSFLALAMAYSDDLESAVNLLSVNHKLDAKNEVKIKQLSAIIHFQKEDYVAALDIINNIRHSDDWLNNRFNNVWTVNLHLLKAITLVELGHKKKADKILIQLIKDYKTTLQEHAPIKAFVSLVRKFIEKEERIHTSVFQKQVSNSFSKLTIEEEDLQTVKYLPWLRAKINKVSYQETLMKAIRKRQGIQQKITE